MHESTVQRTHSTTADGVVAEGLGKRYGDLWAVRDLDLVVPAGRVLGLLGHNGAGKTTAIRMLTTLTRPTTGSARVAGFDVVADAPQVRAAVGLAAQAATVDGLLTARANLELIGRLYHLGRATARSRAAELLEQLDIADAADRLANTLSGGMRRRLDLAATLVGRPPVLFLDEPTTGLDPQSRSELWTLVGGLVRDGVTLVLTTQYLEEADRLADEVVLLDHGRVAACGSPAQLKARVGGDRITVTVAARGDIDDAVAALAPFAEGAAVPDPDRPAVTVPVPAGTPFLELVRAIDGAGVAATDVHRRESTLDDVFLALTTTRAATAREEVAA